jgi:ubiquinone/menaquinone biosynthesis C-methylase UbiE
MEQVEGMFKASAMPDRDWWQALWPDPRRVLDVVGIERGMTVVDLCCGDGYFTAPLSGLVDGRVYGIDLDPRMLERARHEIELVGVPSVQLIEGGAFDLPALVPEKVNYVLLANTFHGVPEQTALSELVHSALKDGGLFGIINWYPKPREETPVFGKPRGPSTETRMSPEAVRKVVEPAGFTLERVVELPPYHYGAVFRKNSQRAVAG